MEGSDRSTSAPGAPPTRIHRSGRHRQGISRKNFKNVFNPGYTTKRRGWGLGLTLAKRIVEQYHGGRIFVKQSTPRRRLYIPH